MLHEKALTRAAAGGNRAELEGVMLTRGSRRAGKGPLRRKGRVSAAFLAPCSVSLRQPPRGRRSGCWQRCPQAPLGGWVGETLRPPRGSAGWHGDAGEARRPLQPGSPGRGGGRHGEPRHGPRPCRARPGGRPRAHPRPRRRRCGAGAGARIGPGRIRQGRRGGDWPCLGQEL